MKIAVACATKRGFLFLQKLFTLEPNAEYIIFSFREEPIEPPFMDDIKNLALSYGALFYEAKQLGAEKWISLWKTEKIDLLFTVSWRFMIPKSVYTQPRLGTFIFHDSLLPEYRGFAPTVWSIVNGEDHTGVSLFAIAEEMDAGDLIDQTTVGIGPQETITEVMPRVTQVYLDMLEKDLPSLMKGKAPSNPQDHSKATFTCKRTIFDNKIHWGDPSQRILNLIRGVTHPYPGAYTFLKNQKFTIWSAEMIDHPHVYVGRVPGRVIEVKPDLGTVVLTSDGAILIKTIQLESEPETCASEILNSISMTLE